MNERVVYAIRPRYVAHPPQHLHFRDVKLVSYSPISAMVVGSISFGILKLFFHDKTECSVDFRSSTRNRLAITEREREKNMNICRYIRRF